MRNFIIGGSIAALSCAQKLKELEKDSEVTILSDEEERPYARVLLPYILSGEVKESDAELEIPQGITFLARKRVKEVIADEKEIVTEEEKFKFDKLLISSGAKAKTSSFEGGPCNLVFTVRNLSDIRTIKEKLGEARRKKVIIFGAGLIGMEMGEAIRKIGYDPVFLVSSRRILSTILDNKGSEILRKDLRKKGIEFHFGEDIKKAQEDGEGIIVQTKSRRKFKGSLLIVGKGFSPNIEFLSSSGIETETGILVNEFLETNKKGIFAAGDVCQGYDKVQKGKRVNALWPVAVEQGKTAAVNMLYSNTPYKGSVSRNIITAFGNTIFAAGLSTKEGKKEEFEIYQRIEGRKYSKVVLREGKLVGAIFMNVEIDTGVYLFAIENELEVLKLKDVLLSGLLSYAHFYPPLYVKPKRIFFSPFMA